MNSPLLLELPPRGQVQVAKTSDVGSASRALIHSRDGERYLSCISYVSFLLKKMLLRFNC